MLTEMWNKLAAGALVAAVATGGAVGQTTQPAQTQAQTQPQTQAAESPEARQVLEETLARYRELTSYQDEPAMNLTLSLAPEGQTPREETQELSGTFAYADEHRMKMTTDEYEVYSNGEKVWVYVKPLEQYTVSELSEGQSPTEVTPPAMPVHPLLPAMQSEEGQTLEVLYPSVAQVTGMESVDREGQAGTVVRGLLSEAPAVVPGGMQTAVPFEVWIAEDSGLIQSLTIDLTQTYQQILQSVPPEVRGQLGLGTGDLQEAKLVVDFVNAQADPELEEGVFEFEPPAGANQVEQFGPPTPEALKGQPAPAFTGTTLEGEELSLEDLRGKVVVMDFWATWCGPCVRAMPLVQEVAQKYEGQPVQVLGINIDQPGMEEEIRQFLDRVGATFPQVLDPDSSIAQNYRASAIPQTVVVDQQGVVREVHVGFSPNLDDQLSQTVDELLAKGGEGNATQPKGD